MTDHDFNELALYADRILGWDIRTLYLTPDDKEEILEIIQADFTIDDVKRARLITAVNAA